REREPILTVESGDTVVARTRDAGWGADPFAEDVWSTSIPAEQRKDPQNDHGHCLVGPIEVRGAEPGMALEVEVVDLQPGELGFTCSCDGLEHYERLGVPQGKSWVPWRIDLAEQT